MSQKFLVWRLCDGHRSASTFEAHGPEDAACRAHGNDCEYNDEELFCVQAIAGDRKVHVVTVEREMVPEYSPERLDKDWLRIRCTCGNRLFTNDGWRGKCRPCYIRAQSAQIESVAKGACVMSDRIDWYNMIARERGAPDGWQWYTMRVVGEDLLVKGCVCTKFKRGPRKGQQNWAKRYRNTEREFVITSEQLTIRRVLYERETGQCSTCQGSGHEIDGWSVHEGTKNKHCSRCKGTGTAPEVQP